MKSILFKGCIFVILLALIFSINKVNKINENIKGQVGTENIESPMVNVSIDGNINTIDMDSYLLGVIGGEMPASFEKEAIKAQIVASRTYVYSRELSVDNTTNSQVYRTDEQLRASWVDNYDTNREKILEAIEETQNEVIKYDGQVISALFFSSSNGNTVPVEQYFSGEPKPYLKSVESLDEGTVDKTNKRTKEFSIDEFKSLLGVNDYTIKDLKKYNTGYIESVNIGNTIFTGRQVREKLSLASSSFTIEIYNNKVVVNTTGSGHGVGMSQYGAQALALKGASYKEILKHYYTDVVIENY